MKREEAIEVVRKNYPHVGSSGTEFETALRELIPELRESEDERIRSVLLNLVSNDKDAGYTKFYEERGITCDDAIAYLEKQKEQDECPEYCVRSHCIGCPIYEKQKEQKPAEWSEEDEHIISSILYLLHSIDNYNFDSWLKSLRNHWKPSEGLVWRIWQNGACGNSDGNPIALVKTYGGYELVSCLGAGGEKYIMLSDLEKLPGFKED